MARKTESGFTLLETLAAFSILAIALGIFYSTFSTSLGRQAGLGDELAALALAENNLARVGHSIPLGITALEGQEGAFSWQLEITPRPDKNSALWLYEVASRVTWRGGQREVSLETLKIGPEVDLGAE